MSGLLCCNGDEGLTDQHVEMEHWHWSNRTSCREMQAFEHYELLPVRVAHGTMKVFRVNVQFTSLLVVSSMYHGFC